MACSQDKPSPTDKWKIDFKLTIEKVGEDHVFVVEGTSNLPAETLLRARVYTVTLVDDFRKGKREDEDPMVWEDDADAGQPGSRTFHAEDGKFRLEVYKFKREPWAIAYRARIHYIPNPQSAAILKIVGEEEFSRAADLTYGDAKVFSRQLRERSKEAYADLLGIESLFTEIKKVYAEHAAKYDAPAWKAWKEGWYARVEKINERNKERYGMWAVWMERQARMRIGGMCELLRRMLVAATDYFEGDKEALVRVQQILDGFHAYYEEAIEVMGLDAPLDVHTVAPAVAAYERSLTELRAWAARREGDLAAMRVRALRQGTEALLAIAPACINRKRAYQYVNDLSSAFRQLLDAIRPDADASAVAAALAEHDKVVAAFKKFAGLK